MPVTKVNNGSFVHGFKRELDRFNEFCRTININENQNGSVVHRLSEMRRYIYSNKDTLNSGDSAGDTPLHLCFSGKLTSSSSVFTAQALLDNGASISIRKPNKAGITPLQLCQQAIKKCNGNAETSWNFEGLLKKMEELDCNHAFRNE